MFHRFLIASFVCCASLTFAKSNVREPLAFDQDYPLIRIAPHSTVLFNTHILLGAFTPQKTGGLITSDKFVDGKADNRYSEDTSCQFSYQATSQTHYGDLIKTQGFVIPKNTQAIVTHTTPLKFGSVSFDFMFLTPISTPYTHILSTRLTCERGAGLSLFQKPLKIKNLTHNLANAITFFENIDVSYQMKFNDAAMAINSDSKGNVYLSFSDGLYVLKNNGQTLEKIHNGHSPFTIRNNSIYVVHFNELWVSQDEGKTFQTLMPLSWESDTFFPRSIQFDRDGNLWACNRWNDGIHVIRHENAVGEKFQNLEHDHYSFNHIVDNPKDAISCLIDSKKNIFVGFNDKQGESLIVSINNGETFENLFDERGSQIYTKKIYSISANQKNDIYVAHDEGVHIFNPFSKSYSIYHSSFVFGKAHFQKSRPVHAINIDVQNNHFVLTFDGSLIKYGAKNHTQPLILPR